MKNVIYILLIFTLISQSCGRNTSAVRPTHNYKLIEPVNRKNLTPPFKNAGQNKCYARSLMPDIYETTIETYPVFSGESEIEASNLKSIDVETRPAFSKQLTHEDLTSPSNIYPESMLGQIVVIPAELETITIVRDTQVIKDFNLQDFESKIMVKSGGYTEWRQVLCETDITAEFFPSFQKSLINAGFLNTYDEQKKKIDTSLKKALVKYQRYYSLPVGNLDMETLKHLGLNEYIDD